MSQNIEVMHVAVEFGKPLCGCHCGKQLSDWPPTHGWMFLSARTMRSVSCMECHSRAESIINEGLKRLGITVY